MSMVVALISVLFVLGAVLAGLGFRGRLEGGHPFCRECRYDLHGLPEGQARCPECGADLRERRAVQHGLRRKRWWLIALGATVATPGLFGLGLLAYVQAAGLYLEQRQPSWYLLWKTDTEADRVGAMKELDRRFQAGELSDAVIAKLSERIVTWQGDVNQAWVPQWGDVLEAAQAAGKVSASQWERYARQAFPSPALSLRPLVRRGDPIVWGIGATGPSRLARQSRLTAQCRFTRMTVPGVVDQSMSAGFNLPWPHINSSVGGGNLIELPEAGLRQLADGPQVLTAEAAVTIMDRTATAFAGSMVLQHTVRLEVPFTLVPADRHIVQIVIDESLREEMEKAISVSSRPTIIFATSRFRESTRTLWVEGGRVQSLVSAKKPPMELGHEIILDDGARQWPVGMFQCDSRGRNSRFDAELVGFDARQVDVILRPSAKAAAQTIELTRIWGGEIVLRAVPVEWSTVSDSAPASGTRRGP